MVPKPVSEPMNAAGLRPAPSSSVCNVRRPDVAGRSALANNAPRSASVSADAKPRRDAIGAVRYGEPAFEPAIAHFAGDILEHDLRAVEPRHAAQTLRHQPRREHRALRLEFDAGR